MRGGKTISGLSSRDENAAVPISFLTNDTSLLAMVHDNSQLTHDEINLLRLLRRLEVNKEEWAAGEEVYLNAQKTRQVSSSDVH